MVAALAAAVLLWQLCGNRLHVAAASDCKNIGFQGQNLNALKEALGDALVDVTAPAAVCDKHNQQTYHEPECGKVTALWKDHKFHAEDPVSNMWNQNSNDSCLPSLLNKGENPGTCDVSGYPSLVINATTPEQIQLAVNFARENNVRFNIKNTGHDYIGRSNAPFSLSIWTHNMKDIKYNEAFDLKGCRNTPISYKSTVTVGAGVQMWDLYRYLQENHDRTFVGGAGPTVGVAGFVMGGGHSILSGKYGLAADQVVEMQVVTPDGKKRTLNECRDHQLFWAMRGGGGSTFGVLTSLTMRTFESPKIAGNLFALAAANADHAIRASSLVWSRLPNIMDKGATAYMFAGPQLPSRRGPFAGLMGSLAFVGSDALEQLNNTLNPIAEEAIAAKLLILGEKVYDNPLQYLQAIQPYISSPAGRNMYLGSRLLSAEALRTGEEKLRSATAAAFSGKGIGGLVVGGEGLHQAKPPRGNAVHPGWRTAVASLFVTADFEPKNKTSEQEAIDYVNAALDPLRELDEKSGCYANEAFPFEPKWRKALFGHKYKRLLRMKEKYDPDGVLWCHHCVGSDKWISLDGKLCKNPKYDSKKDGQEEAQPPSAETEDLSDN